MSDIIVLAVRFSTSFNAAPFVEALEGESLPLVADGSAITSVTTVVEPSPGAGVIDDEQWSVTPGATGRYHFRVRTGDGVDTDVSVICCEAACLARIPDQQRSGGHAVNKRRVLRELARGDQTFAGTAAELANKPLASFGGA